jgi:hypothetical protein
MAVMTSISAIRRLTTHATRNARRLLIGGAALVVLGLVVAACGGSAKTAAGASTASPTTAPASGVPAASGGLSPAALQAFQACLTQHGVTLPTFTPRTTTPGQSPTSSPTAGVGGRGGGAGGLGGVFTNPADQTAVQACQSTLPAGYLAQQQARANQRAAFNSCMADHGVTVAPAAPGSPPPTLDTSSSAYRTCSALLPARPQGGASSPTTTTPASA